MSFVAATQKRPAVTSLPWTQQHAPRSLENVQQQKTVISALTKYVSNVPHSASSMPHMLFYGPPGTGKTTCVNLLARALFKSAPLLEQCVLRLNASDERGIDAVRTRIKTFCELLPPAEAPFKLVVLDECDNMTQTAQFALRRMMESDVARIATNKPRFILMCNYLSRIIAPIASRCSQVRFEPISQATMVDYLARVARRERWPAVSRDALAEVARVSGGDMRSALTLLQSLLKLWGEEARAEHVAELAGQVPLQVVQSMVQCCLEKSFEGVTAHVRALVQREAYCADAILRVFAPVVIESPALSDKCKALVLTRAAEAEYALKKSADEFLQVLRVAVYLRRCALDHPLMKSKDNRD